MYKRVIVCYTYIIVKRNALQSADTKGEFQYGKQDSRN